MLLGEALGAEGLSGSNLPLASVENFSSFLLGAGSVTDASSGLTSCDVQDTDEMDLESLCAEKPLLTSAELVSLARAGLSRPSDCLENPLIAIARVW